MIIKRYVAASVEGATASVDYYGTGEHVTITVNGITCNFPTSVSHNKPDPEHTIQALKEAIGEL